jgi:hypothetical protein
MRHHLMSARTQGQIMKILAGALGALAISAMCGAAFSEPYDDYTPRKGAWQITEVHVDPNHIDDYLTGLRTGWVPGQEIAKKHGLIDDYYVMVRLDAAGTGANVLLGTHYTSLAAFEPDKARDKLIEKESYDAVPKAKSDVQVAGYDKYRTFVGDGLYQTMDFTK